MICPPGFGSTAVAIWTDQLLLLRHGLPRLRLRFEILVHLGEVALLQVCYLRLLLGCHFLFGRSHLLRKEVLLRWWGGGGGARTYLPPVFKEVLAKDVFGGVLVVQHLGEERGHLLCTRTQHEGLT